MLISFVYDVRIRFDFTQTLIHRLATANLYPNEVSGIENGIAHKIP